MGCGCGKKGNAAQVRAQAQRAQALIDEHNKSIAPSPLEQAAATVANSVRGKCYSDGQCPQRHRCVNNRCVPI